MHDTRVPGESSSSGLKTTFASLFINGGDTKLKEKMIKPKTRKILPRKSVDDKFILMASFIQSVIFSTKITDSANRNILVKNFLENNNNWVEILFARQLLKWEKAQKP